MPTSLFQEIKIRDLTIPNRAWVSPMCQYSAKDGLVGEWHRVHLGAFATGGAGLVFVEATGVVPEGRISIACPGIWNDNLAQAFKPIVDFNHSMGSTIGIQLAHAGRKGSTMSPWDDHPIASEVDGGWQTVSASDLAFTGMPAPRALSKNEIAELTENFGSHGSAGGSRWARLRGAKENSQAGGQNGIATERRKPPPASTSSTSSASRSASRGGSPPGGRSDSPRGDVKYTIVEGRCLMKTWRSPHSRSRKSPVLEARSSARLATRRKAARVSGRGASMAGKRCSGIEGLEE